MEPGISTLIAVRALLAIMVLGLAAWAYDRLIAHLVQHGYLDGYAALAVAAGCAVVLLVALWVVWPLGLTAWVAVTITAGLFVPAGLPMILGSIKRHVAARERELQRLMAESRKALQ